MEKLINLKRGEPVSIGATYYDDEGQFYHDGYLKAPPSGIRPDGK
jgi:hypothetical protein